MEVRMTRRTVGLISIVLVLVIGLGTLISVPAVRADTTAHVSVTDKAASVADKAAADVKLAALKTLGQQIREAAKAVWEKAKAAKDAKKDLSAFKEDLKTVKEDLKTVFKSRHNLRHNIQRMRKPQLTAAERTQLKGVEVRAHELKKQLKAKIDAKPPQAEIDALKAQLKTVIAEREALVKAFRARARAQFFGRLDSLIAKATKELTFLQGLLVRLP
jgi:flagellar biosynthesis chaperone FliJ